MAKKFREDIEIKSSLANHSGLVTKNMTSTTPDKIAGTSWKNVIVDENGEIMVGNADIPASSICSGNPVSATNKLLTSDTLTTNTTPPVTVVATPDPAITPYTQAVKVLNGCNEDIYVPYRTPVRRTLTPNVTLTPNLLVPNIVNNAGKDSYIYQISYTDTAPTGGNWYVDFSAKQTFNLEFPNHDGQVYGYLVGTGGGFADENTDNYSKDQNKAIPNMSSQKRGVNQIAPSSAVSFLHQIEFMIDTGIALVTSSGTLNMTFNNNLVEYIPA